MPNLLPIWRPFSLEHGWVFEVDLFEPIHIFIQVHLDLFQSLVYILEVGVLMKLKFVQFGLEVGWVHIELSDLLSHSKLVTVSVFE